MSDRIQKALDGELERERLDAAERAELEAYDEAVDRALSGVRSEETPDLTRAVMSRVSALPRHGRAAAEPAWKRALTWIWAPRPVTIRPAWGLAMAALAGLLLLPPALADRSGAGAEGPALAGGRAAPAAPERVFVHFRLDAADAASVQLAADFTGWEPTYSLNESAPGIWTVVVPVDAGVHQYAFVVDGHRWVADPLAPRVDDGFGGSNSRLDVVTPDPARAL